MVFQLMKTDEEKNKGFGFVSFEDASAAEAACDDLNGKEVSGKTIYVGRAQKKAERQMELKKKFEQMKIERMTRYQLLFIIFCRFFTCSPSYLNCCINA